MTTIAIAIVRSPEVRITPAPAPKVTR